MRTIARILLVAVLAAGLGLATPAQAAPEKYQKKLTSTVMFPALDSGTWFGAGYGNWIGTAQEDLSAVRQACVGGKAGQFDGYIWRFFDLKGKYKKFLASGPKPLFAQDTPVGVFHDYDIDIYFFDDKCKRIVMTGVNAGGGIEKASTPDKKPASYAVIVYWYGHQPNLPLTLEFSP